MGEKGQLVIKAEIYRCFLNCDDSQTTYSVCLRIGNNISQQSSKSQSISLSIIQFNQKLHLKSRKDQLKNADKLQILLWKYKQNQQKQIFAIASTNINDLGKKQRRKLRLINKIDKCALVQVRIFLQDNLNEIVGTLQNSQGTSVKKWNGKMQNLIPQKDKAMIQNSTQKQSKYYPQVLFQSSSKFSEVKTHPQHKQNQQPSKQDPKVMPCLNNQDNHTIITSLVKAARKDSNQGRYYLSNEYLANIQHLRMNRQILSLGDKQISQQILQKQQSISQQCSLNKDFVTQSVFNAKNQFKLTLKKLCFEENFDLCHYLNDKKRKCKINHSVFECSFKFDFRNKNSIDRQANTDMKYFSEKIIATQQKCLINYNSTTQDLLFRMQQEIQTDMNLFNSFIQKTKTIHNESNTQTNLDQGKISCIESSIQTQIQPYQQLKIFQNAEVQTKQTLEYISVSLQSEQNLRQENPQQQISPRSSQQYQIKQFCPGMEHKINLNIESFIYDNQRQKDHKVIQKPQQVYQVEKEDGEQKVKSKESNFVMVKTLDMIIRPLGYNVGQQAYSPGIRTPQKPRSRLQMIGFIPTLSQQKSLLYGDPFPSPTIPQVQQPLKQSRSIFQINIKPYSPNQIKEPNQPQSLQNSIFLAQNNLIEQKQQFNFQNNQDQLQDSEVVTQSNVQDQSDDSDSDGGFQRQYSNRKDMKLQALVRPDMQNCYELQEANDFLQMTNDTISGQLTSTQTSLKLHLDECHKSKVSKSAYTTLQNSSEQLKKQLKKLQIQHKQLSQQRTSLQQSQKQLNSTINKLKAENQQINKNFKLIRNQLHFIQSQNESKGLAVKLSNQSVQKGKQQGCLNLQMLPRQNSLKFMDILDGNKIAAKTHRINSSDFQTKYHLRKSSQFSGKTQIFQDFLFKEADKYNNASPMPNVKRFKRFMQGRPRTRQPSLANSSNINQNTTTNKQKPSFHSAKNMKPLSLLFSSLH